MSDELRVGISAGVGIFILFSGYIFSFFNVKFGKAKFIDRAKAKGHYVQGRLVDTKIRVGDRTSTNQDIRSNTMKVTYEYFVNGVSYKKKMSFKSPGMATIQYPGYVNVYYDERNPKKCACQEEATRSLQQGKGCLFSIALSIITVAVLVNVLKLF